jgi:hypothetical protein
MTAVYIVRCNFAEPSKVQAWNEWYNGPKIAQMLQKPHFRSCQRFRRTGGGGRDYLALWVLDSPDAFKTREYTSDWGFFDWQQYVTDWSRDLFDGGAAAEQDFAVTSGGALEVVAFDGISPADAEAARAALAASEPDILWLPVIGLDRHTPLIGLCPRSDPEMSDPETHDRSTAPPVAGAQWTFYRPISAYVTAGATV